MFPDIIAYVPNSMIDWEGKIVLSLFLGGCNFDCVYCHNYGIVHYKETNIYNPLDLDSIIEYLEKRKDWLDGVVISGGEPLLSNKVYNLLTLIKELDYLIKIDTNGSFPKRLKRVIKDSLVDYIAMDIKTSSEKYASLVQKPVDLTSLLESVKTILESDVDHEFKTTVLPGFVEEEDILSIARTIKEGDKYFLQQYNSENVIYDSIKSIKKFPKAVLMDFQYKARKYIPTYLRGVN